MFDFIRKATIFDAWSAGLQKPIDTGAFHLKTVQDLGVWLHLNSLKGKTIAEIGGGNSRILPALAKNNKCYNVEKFQGADGGPTKEVKIPNVTNILAFLGEGSGKIPKNYFDVIFSVSVIEHVTSLKGLNDFFTEGLSGLKSGGLWLHAIDMYLSDEPEPYWAERYSAYRSWVTDSRVTPLSIVYDGPLKFSCEMASNPDDTMFQWNRISPSLNALRKKAQSVSLILAARKV